METLDLGLVFGLNIVALIAAIIIGAIVGEKAGWGRGLGSWVAYYLVFIFSVFAWIVIVIVHFLGKVW